MDEDDLYSRLDESIEDIGALIEAMDGLAGSFAQDGSAGRDALLRLQEELEQSQEELDGPWQGDVGLQCAQAWRRLERASRAQALLRHAVPQRP